MEVNSIQYLCAILSSLFMGFAVGVLFCSFVSVSEKRDSTHR